MNSILLSYFLVCSRNIQLAIISSPVYGWLKAQKTDIHHFICTSTMNLLKLIERRDKEHIKGNSSAVHEEKLRTPHIPSFCKVPHTPPLLSVFFLLPVHQNLHKNTQQHRDDIIKTKDHEPRMDIHTKQALRIETAYMNGIWYWKMCPVNNLKWVKKKKK